MLEFLATPFLLIANIMLWVAAFIQNTTYILLEVEEDDEDES